MYEPSFCFIIVDPETIDRLLKLLLNYKPPSASKTEAGVTSFTASAQKIAKTTLDSFDRKPWRVW